MLHYLSYIHVSWQWN